MATSIINWAAPWTDRSTVLTTEMNSLGAGSRSNAGTALDNRANLDQYAVAYFNCTHGSAPAAGGSYDLCMLPSYDGGTTYVDGSSTVNPGAHTIVATVEVKAQTGQKIVSQPFLLPPEKVKFLLVNRGSTAFGASGNTVNIFTFNDESQ